MSAHVFSFQLFSARKFPPLERQLEALVELGYHGVEPYPDIVEGPAEAFRGMIESTGLKVPSLVSSVGFIDRDRERLFDIAQGLGTETVVLSYLAPEERPLDQAGWRAFGERLQAHAEAARTRGLAFAWHNHAFECLRLGDGTRPIDAILESPAVLWEADVGWLARAECDVPVDLARYASRIGLVHMKDMAPPGTTLGGGWADVGSGILDWESIWPAVRRTGAELLVVEHDDPPDWLASAASSIAFLRTLVAGDGLRRSG